MLKFKRKFRRLRVKGRRGYSHLKEEALDRTMWRSRFVGALNLSSDRILNDDDAASLGNEFTTFRKNLLSLFSKD